MISSVRVPRSWVATSLSMTTQLASASLISACTTPSAVARLSGRMNSPPALAFGFSTPFASTPAWCGASIASRTTVVLLLPSADLRDTRASWRSIGRLKGTRREPPVVAEIGRTGAAFRDTGLAGGAFLASGAAVDSGFCTGAGATVGRFLRTFSSWTPQAKRDVRATGSLMLLPVLRLPTRRCV